MAPAPRLSSDGDHGANRHRPEGLGSQCVDNAASVVEDDVVLRAAAHDDKVALAAPGPEQILDGFVQH